MLELEYLQNLIIERVASSTDADLLDLVLKLLISEG